jgi:hypothetical protein
MKSKVTSIAVHPVGNGIEIMVTANSAHTSITIPADAATALAGLLADGKADTLLSPDWTTAAEREAARKAVKGMKAALGLVD